MKSKKYFLICLTIFVLVLLFMVRIAFSADIDVGSAATDRGSSADTLGYTTIATENPANASGTIDHIEIFMNSATSAVIDVAAFEQVDTNTFTSRGSSGNLNVVAGLNTFNAPGDFTAFDIEAGDYIGFYGSGTANRIEQDTSGDGKWYSYADRIPCTNQLFTAVASRTISLYAEGTISGGPPAPKIQSQILILE